MSPLSYFLKASYFASTQLLIKVQYSDPTVSSNELFSSVWVRILTLLPTFGSGQSPPSLTAHTSSVHCSRDYSFHQDAKEVRGASTQSVLRFASA